LDRIDEAYAALDRALYLRAVVKADDIIHLAKAKAASVILQRLAINVPREVSKHTAFPPILQVALLNGDFELGLSTYWGRGPYKPTGGLAAWLVFGDCRTSADVTNTTCHGGVASLRIRNDSPRALGVFALTEQTVALTPGTRYRVSVWAKTENLTADGLVIRVACKDTREAVSLPTGTYDWKSLSGDFTADASVATVSIVSQNTGTIWLDDLRIEAVD
jgi:hypothetical protein